MRVNGRTKPTAIDSAYQAGKEPGRAGDVPGVRSAAVELSEHAPSRRTEGYENKE